MIVFWLLAAVLTALAVGLVLHPLMRRRAQAEAPAAFARRVYADQVAEIDRDLARGVLTETEAKAARAEVGRRLLAAAREEETAGPTATMPGAPGTAANTAPGRAAMVLTILLPVAALSFYLPIGRPDLPAQPLATRADLPQIPENVVAAAASLARKLEENPDNLEGWSLLGSTYAAMRRHAEAAEAFRRASALSQGDVELTGAFAEQLVMAANGLVGDEPRRVFEAVLEADPTDVRARYYLAIGRLQAGDPKGAIDGWAAIVADSPADAPWLDMVRRRIFDAAVSIGLDPVRLTPQPKPPAMAQAAPEAPTTPAENAPGPTAEQIQAAQSMAPADQQAMIRGMVEGLAQRLEKNPNDADGWLRLARARQVLGERDKAVEALRRALAALPPGDPRRADTEAQLKALGG